MVRNDQKTHSPLWARSISYDGLGNCGILMEHFRGGCYVFCEVVMQSKRNNNSRLSSCLLASKCRGAVKSYWSIIQSSLKWRSSGLSPKYCCLPSILASPALKCFNLVIAIVFPCEEQLPAEKHAEVFLTETDERVDSPAQASNERTTRHVSESHQDNGTFWYFTISWVLILSTAW